MTAGYIPKPQPEIWNGKLHEPKLSCESCGEPGTWRAREFGSNYVLGETLCDKCDSRLYNFLNEPEVNNMEEVHKKFIEFLNALRAAKPNDRSEKDRYFAIVITEIEKAYAVFETFVRK